MTVTALRPPACPPTTGASGVGGKGFDELDYQGFAKTVQSRYGARLCEYKGDQMHRRLRTLAEKQGYSSFAAYLSGMQSRPELLAAFLDTMTINVTELMRNPERFEELTRDVLPGLLALARPGPLSVWSAGCSYGAEAYTLAMLLHEKEPTVAHRIRGTDIDLTILAKANSISFSGMDMAGVSPARRQTHFQDLSTGLPGADTPLSPRFRPQKHLCGRVQFSRHDLLADAYPNAEHHLIACRNVLIYFTDEAKERIYQGFFRALKPGGILFVGGTERLSDHRAIGFELIRPFFYRKPVN